MTETEAETDPTQESQTDAQPEDKDRSESYCLQQTGGHKLTQIKPVFTNDSKYLLVASGHCLRQYIVETGAFLTSHTFGNELNIVSVQSLAKNDEVMVTFIDGSILFWDLIEDRKVSEFVLKINRVVDTLIWCQLVHNYFYFTTIKNTVFSEGKMQTKCQIHFSPKNLVEQDFLVENSSEVNRTINSVAFCPTSDPKYCVSIHQNILYIHEIPVRPLSIKKRHFINEDKHFTCVESHPSQEMIATGDSLGQIIIWQNFAETNYPSRSVWHWHQWPVADICFSPEGSALYSAGKEMVLVKWYLSGQHFGQNEFRPRLGEPIKYLTVDPNLNMIAIAHEDNTIKIMGPQMKGIKSLIEGLTTSLSGLLTGLQWNQKMKAIAYNGRTGHLQFYSTERQKHLFQLDVVSQNLLSGTKEAEVIPIEVTKATISDDGVWLSTFEIRDDFETSPEMRLKFWKIKQNFKNYILNTTIHLPHNSGINCLEFSPDSESMVSTSNDREFKVWNLIEDKDKQWWKCFKVGNLNGLSIPSMAKWSADCSLLAVTFDHFITLWDYLNKTSLKFMEKLSVEEKLSKLIFVDFGKEDKSHYLIEGRNYSIKIWNLLDLSVVWELEKYETINCFAFNKWENKLAMITEKNIEFFDIDSNISCRTIPLQPKNMPIIDAIFTNESNDDSKTDPLLTGSKLFVMNDKQELFVVTRKFKTEIIRWNVTTKLTPIAQMLINKRGQKQEISDGLESYFKTNRSISKLVEDMFVNVPSHVLPPIDILSKTFLQSLNNCREETNETETNSDFKSFKKPNDLDSEPMIVSDDENESDVQSINSHEKETNASIPPEETEEEQIEVIDEDYSWLKKLKIK